MPSGLNAEKGVNSMHTTIDIGVLQVKTVSGHTIQIVTPSGESIEVNALTLLDAMRRACMCAI